MTTIATALQDGGLTWKSGDGDDDWELHGDGDVLGRIRGDIVTLDGRRYEISHGRGYTTLVHVGLRSRMASLRVLGHGAGQVTLPTGQARVSKQGVGPFKWEVTDDLSGPRLLDLTHLFGRLSIKPVDGLAATETPAASIDVLVVFVALVVIPALRTRTVAAAA